MSLALSAQLPPQKKRPEYALPEIPISQDTQFIPIVQTTTTRRRSSTVTAIATWAAQVQPGSPAPLTPCVPCTPCTPRTPRSARSTSHRRHRSFSTSSRVSRLGSPTLVQFEPLTPTQLSPSTRQRPAAVSLDLLAQGYTSFVVRLPVQSPVAPHTLHTVKSHQDIDSIPIPPIPQSPEFPHSHHSRSRSFSLKSAKSFMMLSSKSRSSHHSKSKSSTPRARYGHLMAPGGGAGALPLATEVQLSQMLDGGSLDANIKRVVTAHAKSTGAVPRKKDRGIEDRTRTPNHDRSNVMGVDGKIGGGVSGIYRDEKGGLYWDEDEVWELEGLLKEEDNATNAADAKRSAPKRSFLRASSKPNTQSHTNPDWVTLDNHHAQAISTLRRESIVSSTSSGSRDSDLDVGYTVRPREMFSDAPRVDVHLRRRADALEAFNLADAQRVADSTTATPRPRPRPRQRPAPLALALDEVPPHVIPPTQIQYHQPRHHSSRSHHKSSRHTSSHTRTHLPPLPPAPGAVPTASSAMASEGKKDFFESSFAPVPVANAAHHAPVFATPATSFEASKSQGRRGSLTTLVGALSLKGGRRASLTPVSPSANYTPYGHAHGASIASASTTSFKSKNPKTSIFGMFKR